MPPGAADCQDPGELAVIQAEGSPMGPLLRAVNEIARALAADFPLVAVDTLAYQCASGGRQTVLCVLLLLPTDRCVVLSLRSSH